MRSSSSFSDESLEPRAAFDKGQLTQIVLVVAKQIVGAQMDRKNPLSALARLPCD